MPIWIRSKHTSNREVLYYCIIGEPYNACFMSKELKEQLDLSEIDTNLILSTVFKSNVIIYRKRVDHLEILNFDRDE